MTHADPFEPQRIISPPVGMDYDEYIDKFCEATLFSREYAEASFWAVLTGDMPPPRRVPARDRLLATTLRAVNWTLGIVVRGLRRVNR